MLTVLVFSPMTTLVGAQNAVTELTLIVLYFMHLYYLRRY